MHAHHSQSAVEAIRERDLLTSVQMRGAVLRAGREAALVSHLPVGDIRGRGLFQAIELVFSRETKTCFDPKRRIHAEIRAAATSRGLLHGRIVARR